MEHLHCRQVEFLASWFSKEGRFHTCHFHVHKVYSPSWGGLRDLEAFRSPDQFLSWPSESFTLLSVWRGGCMTGLLPRKQVWGGGLHSPGRRPHQPWKSSKNLTFIKSVIWKKKPQLPWSGVYEAPRNGIERPKVDSVGKMQILRPLTGGLLLSALAFQTFSEGLQAEPSLCHPSTPSQDPLFSALRNLQGHSLLVLKLVGLEYKN